MTDFEVIPFEPGHLDLLSLQSGQEYFASKPALGEGVRAFAHGYTGILLNGGSPRVIGCAGITPMWPGRAVAWALLSQMGPQAFGGVHRAVRDFLDGCNVRRVEAAVHCDFENGHRWAKLLGFRREIDCMAGYGPNGDDYSLYVRLR